MQITWSFFKRLTKENVRSYVPREAGVYLLWVKLTNDTWRCYYVGQADDMERRLLQHLSDDEENECIKTNVQDYISGYQHARVAKESDRDGIEEYLYDHYRPECNDKDPGGEPIEVNLP